MVLYGLVFPEEGGSSGRLTGQAAPGEHGGGPEAGPGQGPRLPGGHAQQVSRLLTHQTGRTHPQVEQDIREGVPCIRISLDLAKVTHQAWQMCVTQVR